MACGSWKRFEGPSKICGDYETADRQLKHGAISSPESLAVCRNLQRFPLHGIRLLLPVGSKHRCRGSAGSPDVPDSRCNMQTSLGSLYLYISAEQEQLS